MPSPHGSSEPFPVRRKPLINEKMFMVAFASCRELVSILTLWGSLSYLTCLLKIWKKCVAWRTLNFPSRLMKTEFTWEHYDQPSSKILMVSDSCEPHWVRIVLLLSLQKSNCLVCLSPSCCKMTWSEIPKRPYHFSSKRLAILFLSFCRL